MTNSGAARPFNILIVAQKGRLQYEALLFAASLRHSSPGFAGRLFVAVPQPGPLWDGDPGISDPDLRDMLLQLGAEILPFHSQVFGRDYPHGNKIEALAALPEGEPFVFFDSDTLITGELAAVPFDFAHPSASQRCEGTWPVPTLYGPGREDIWRALFERFGLDFETSLDPGRRRDDWRRYLYFNAGWFYHACPRRFGALFLDHARTIRDDPPVELAGQSLDPWLDQVALPLVIHRLGGGRDRLPPGLLDGAVSCHYRHFPLLYAREGDHVVRCLETVAAPNRLKKLLKAHPPIRRLVYRGHGAKVRGLFDRDRLPPREQAIRNRIRAAGLWMR
ncbi:hypothetical protein [Pontibaca methylaminivorans]|uniref:Uncharacterized protein n=1 Tax=Pontibaca methylaminivorans TaxID=515897 RepID=A0A1R3W8H6_9RHOB|nr:hypothetical protein [Pontibaca methylaminivorans]SIT74258.1 hypothetical protein SAMN05421849_0126 [Pontibaca methylaminivorans]